MMQRTPGRSRVGGATITAFAAVAAAALLLSPAAAQRASISTRPDTPFKLATVDVQGKLRLGMAVGDKLIDIAAANAALARSGDAAARTIPGEMRELIEQYDRVSPRLYQIANAFKAGVLNRGAIADLAGASIKAPIMYPWNLLNLAANYRAHAEGMGGAGAAGGGRQGGFNAAAAAQIDPDRDAPIVFAKSPRSCIIGTGEPYYIPPGREKIDWEGELGIVMGRPAYRVPRDRALDYVFGYTILYDLSDRAGRARVVTMFPGPNWFDGKSIDRGAPFGPFIVPREFLPNANDLHLTTKVNGIVKQDANTRDMIWDAAHQIAFITSIQTLYPGDLISSGTPSGTGAERNEFLKPGDVVTIEIEGIGVLTTPIKALSQKPS
jgi:2,4-didehydro-3-deoxy-L-rhamnonate hydrolase